METIKEVYENKANGQLLVTVPKKKGFKKGDHVRITKVEEKQNV